MAAAMRGRSSRVDTPPGAISRSASEVDEALIEDEHAASHRPAHASNNSSRRFMGNRGKGATAGQISDARVGHLSRMDDGLMTTQERFSLVYKLYLFSH